MPSCFLESTGMGFGGVGVDDMQKKAEAQPAWLQLAAGASELGKKWENLKTCEYTCVKRSLC